MTPKKDKFAAGEQGLGYAYQIRFALAYLMSQGEGPSLLIEADDDVQLVQEGGQSTLVSLKHKKAGETLGTLGVDFWKSVRIWLTRYLRDGKVACDHRYCLTTTARVGSTSMLRYFLTNAPAWPEDFVSQLIKELSSSQATLTSEILGLLGHLSAADRRDFFSRVTIADGASRILDLDAQIEGKLLAVRKKHRVEVRERLEGWWTREAIAQILRDREPISAAELWEKVAVIMSEYSDDNLPITFDESFPEGGVDAANDPRQFVEQLRAIGMPTSSLEHAILDFHRAYAQRSHWLRVNVLVGDEIRKFEAKLVDEWTRMKAYMDLSPDATEIELAKAGKELYKWAEVQSSEIRIRSRVTEEYVRRGSFHILADEAPSPRVHWHPMFLERLKAAVVAAQ